MTGEVKDEWNTDEIIDEHILNNKRLMIRASLPGSGKSYIVNIYKIEITKSCLLCLLII